MAQSLDAVVAGHICLDIIPRFDASPGDDFSKLMRPGALIKVGDAVIGTGGAVSNTGIALAKLGFDVAFMASVGEDAFGSIILEKMSAYGNTAGFFRNPDVGSSYSVILAPPGLDRIIFHNPGCNDCFTAEHIDWPLVGRARLFHLGYPPIMRDLYLNEGRACSKILQRVKTLGVATSLDMALPDPHSEAGKLDWKAWLRNVLPFVDFFIPSIEELLLFWDRQRWQGFRSAGGDFVDTVPVEIYTELSEALLDLGCAVVMIKAGRRGIFLRSATQKRLRHVPLFEAKQAGQWAQRQLWGLPFRTETILSAAGAGDSAVAGMLAALLQDKSPEETLQLGNCLGYQNLRALDTTSGVGTLDETEALVRSLPVRTPDFDLSGWEQTAFRAVLKAPRD